ncbi:MAG TPA: TerC family protein [Myxococcota bacterium]|jgi:predicted tellurium resistance membrane protein TerC|nr:TerC family protein [Myxococcota bacterium]
MSLHWITDPQSWIALATLTVLELVLGIDNIVFISVLSGKLPTSQQPRARRLGLGLALISRIALLSTLTWIARLTTPLVTLAGFALSGRDLILVLGGLFLLAKSTHEIHGKLEGLEDERALPAHPSFASVLVQIMLLDVVFSLDSVITAVGMVQELEIMVLAVMIAVALMMIAAEPVSSFVERHPTVKMLALSFLLLIGVALLADGFHHHIPRGYIYFAMGFSVCVEMLNLRLRRKALEPVHLRGPHLEPKGRSPAGGAR